MPMFIVACLAIISGDNGVSSFTFRSFGSGCSGSTGRSGCMAGTPPLFSIDLGGSLVSSGSEMSFSSPSGVPGLESSSSDGKSPFVAMLGGCGGATVLDLGIRKS